MSRQGPKLCKDCRYVQITPPKYNPNGNAPSIHRCTRTVDIVTGASKPTVCMEVRKSERLCGHVGKWFKPVEEVVAAE